MYYYAVSITGYETYEPVIIAVPNKITFFGTEVQQEMINLFIEWLNSPDKTINSFPTNFDINTIIAERLVNCHNGTLVEFEEEYELNEFVIHHFTYPALIKAQVDNGEENVPFKNQKSVFPSFIEPQLQDKLFDALVESYKVQLEQERIEAEKVNNQEGRD